MAEASDDRRNDLLAHIDKSRAVQHRVVRIAAVVGALALVLMVAGAGTAVALGLAALAAIVGGAGVWITQGHITDFQRQLHDLARKQQRQQRQQP